MPFAIGLRALAPGLGSGTRRLSGAGRPFVNWPGAPQLWQLLLDYRPMLLANFRTSKTASSRVG